MHHDNRLLQCRHMFEIWPQHQLQPFMLTSASPVLYQYLSTANNTEEKACVRRKSSVIICLWTQHEILRNVRCVCAGGSATFSCVAAGGGLASKAEPVGDKQLHLLTRGEWWLLKASKDPSVAFAGQHEAKNASQNERVVWIFWI